MSNREDIRADILSAVARAFYTEAWLSNHEGDEVPVRTPSRSAQRFALLFVRSLEALNDKEPLEVAYERALQANVTGKTYGNRNTPEDFGYYLAMQAMGHGVSWLDDNAPFSFVLVEAHFYGTYGEIDDRFLSNYDGTKPSVLPQAHSAILSV